LVFNKRALPAVRGVVAETDTLTIYNADDSSLPVWASFDFSGFTVQAVSALNGQILVATSTGLVLLDLPKDNIDIALSYTTTTDIAIVNNVCNDVALTELSDAPIDPRTGLKAVTAAVATDGGVSVIKNIGTDVEEVVDSSYSDLFNSVDSDSKGRLFASETTGADTFFVFDEYDADGFTGIVYNNLAVPYTNTTVLKDGCFVSDDLAVASNDKGFMLVKANPSDKSKESISYITSKYNTGYMPGDIKLAALADTDTTDLVDTDLVTNGDFATDSDWDKFFGATIESETANLPTEKGQVRQAITTQANAVYILSFDVVTAASRGVVWVGTTSGAFDVYASPAYITTIGAKSISFVAAGSTTHITINNNTGSDGVWVVDNISIKRADADRSVNANHLSVAGTITRTPVATGADTVAYSGFSATNYLYQPYNADLDFGTGDFYVMGWVKVVSPAAVKAISVRACPGTGYGTVYFGLDADATNIRFLINGIAATAPLPSGLFFVAAVRAAGVAYLYVDGQLKDSAANANSVDKDDAILGVGASLYSSAFDRALGSSSQIARLRIGAGSLSADQIRDYYEAEKPLFQENAQATLYGTSDAVTCLAYDDGLLHVGTSDGRSTFSGLQRVANTEVGITSISAQDGLIIEG
jgi:hypothetical protein